MAQLLVVEDNADILHLIWTQPESTSAGFVVAGGGPVDRLR